jgi:cyclopropane fatty-acyl-phospholipid synthase-like methyltransferase
LPVYDPLVKLHGGNAARTMLRDQAEISSGHRVLDIGCGTGTLLVQLKRDYPTVEAVGLNPDPRQTT